MIHEEYIIHVLLIEHRQIMNFLFIGQKIANRSEALRPPAYFGNDKELRDKTLGEEKTGFFIRIDAAKLLHKGFNIGIGRKGSCRPGIRFRQRRLLLDQFSCLISV